MRAPLIVAEWNDRRSRQAAPLYDDLHLQILAASPNAAAVRPVSPPSERAANGERR